MSHAAAASATSSSSTSSRDEIIAEFCSLTGMGDVNKNNNREFAESFLSGHDYQLESAVNAYLEMKADNGGGGVDGGDQGQLMEEQVRAPLPDKVDQLFDDVHERGTMQMMMSGGRSLLGRVTRAARGVISSIDPFRNFAEETKITTASTGSKKEYDKKAAKLSQLFQPPDAIIYRTAAGDASFDAASAYALEKQKWLLINVQQGDEFASHQLNRDVWNQKATQELIKKHFVFCQPSHNTASGMRYQSLYRPPSLPTVAIIDPITKQKVWDIHEAGGGNQIIVDKKLIKILETALKDFAARTDLSVLPSSASKSSAADEEQRLLQAAINASLASSPASSPIKGGPPSRTTSSTSTLAAAASLPSRPTTNGSASLAPKSLSSALSTSGPNPKSSASSLTSSAASSAHGATKPKAGTTAAIPIDIDDEDEVYVIDSDGEMDAQMDAHDSDYEPPPETSPDVVDMTNEHKQAPAMTTSAKRKRESFPEPSAPPMELADEEKSSKVPRTSLTSTPSSSLSTTSTSTSLSSESTVTLPPEPAVGAPNVCRLQIRLPGGKPAQRRFLKTDPIKLVYAFTRTLLDPESQTKKFLLVSTMPRRELSDMELSIDGHGVANASVILEWI